jgi:hypothetical protein
MKYLKTINELFDDSDMKSKFEIPYLQGDIDFKNIASNKSLVKDGDNLLGRLSMNCPYIGHLSYKRLSSSLLNIGFQTEINLDGIIYFVIEIMEHASSKKYLCNSYAKCVIEGKTLYDKKINKSLMGYNELVTLLNNEVLDMLVDFNKFTNDNYKVKEFPFTDRNYMSGLNIGRN